MGTVIHLNTSLERILYLDEAAIEAFCKRTIELTDYQHRVGPLSERFVDALILTVLVALSTPIWNLGIPAPLKTWIDLIVREGGLSSFRSMV